MTATRYDVLAAREYTDRSGDKKSSFLKVGVAFPMRDKDGFSLQLEAVPAPQDGVYKLLLMPPKEKDGAIQTSSGRHTPTGSRGGSRPMDDDGDSIPFSAPVL